MSSNKSDFSKEENGLNKVYKLQDNRLKEMQQSAMDTNHVLDQSIDTAEKILASVDNLKSVNNEENAICNMHIAVKPPIIRTWKEISDEAENQIPYEVSIRDIFTREELESNETYLVKLREEFNAVYHLDAVDFTICGVSGLLSAAVDIFLVGMPQSPLAGIEGGSLSNYIRGKIEESMSPSEIRKLEKDFWVPYDPSNNKYLKIPVEGLSSYFHRFHSLGHDPILGFVFGVIDVMNGTFTAVDVKGNFIRQDVLNQKTAGMKLFKAVDTVLGHMKSDIATPRGLPAPLTTLLNLFQFGNIGEEGLSVADVARSMYGQGYDFSHFLSMSVPVGINEVITRTSYCAKRVNEGYSLLESLPFDLPLNKKPKLSTMLFISHSIATALNAGKITFTKNPLAINYPQWMAFAKYSVSQLKWALIQKPELRDKYVQGIIDRDWLELNSTLEKSWREFTLDTIHLDNA